MKKEDQDQDIQMLQPVEPEEKDQGLTWRQIIESKDPEWVNQFKTLES